MNIKTLGIIAGASALAYIGAKRSSNQAKAQQALADPGKVKAFSVDESGNVNPDESAKARAAVALAASAGSGVAPGTKLADGSEVLATKTNIYGESSAIIRKPDGNMVVSVPVYTNGSVNYYEIPIDSKYLYKPPSEINGVKLPDIPPLINLGRLSQDLNVGDVIKQAGVGAVTRAISAISEYNQQWYEKRRDVALSVGRLSIAYSQAAAAGMPEAQQLLPLYVSTLLEDYARQIAVSEASADSWLHHVGGDTAFNQEKYNQMKEISRQAAIKAGIAADALKNLGITTATPADSEQAKGIVSQITQKFPGALGESIRRYNEEVRRRSEELSGAGGAISSMTGLPVVSNAAVSFYAVLQRAGGDPAKLEQALREYIQSLPISASQTYLGTLEESSSPSAQAELQKIMSDPNMKAFYDQYKQKLTQIRGEYIGKTVAIPIQYTTGVFGPLARAGVDAKTIADIQSKFGNVKDYYDYLLNKYGSVGWSGLTDAEKKAYYIYIFKLPPEAVRDINTQTTSTAQGQGGVPTQTASLPQSGVSSSTRTVGTGGTLSLIHI